MAATESDDRLFFILVMGVTLGVVILWFCGFVYLRLAARAARSNQARGGTPVEEDEIELLDQAQRAGMAPSRDVGRNADCDVRPPPLVLLGLREPIRYRAGPQRREEVS